MSGYADTSFVISLFANDANSFAAKATISANPVPLYWTGWHDFEFTNALCLREFRGYSDGALTTAIHQQLSRDLAAGLFVRSELNHERVLSAARTLALTHTAAVGARSLDILHVAAAVVLRAECFFTFDSRQAELAKSCGLTVLP